jgi:hypothetical protein
LSNASRVLGVSVSVSISVTHSKADALSCSPKVLFAGRPTVIFWNWQDCKLILCDNLEHRSFAVCGMAAALPTCCREGKFEGLSVFLAKWRSMANKNIKHGQIIRPCSIEARKMSLLVGIGVELNGSCVFETHCERLKACVKKCGMAEVLPKLCQEEEMFKDLCHFITCWHWRARVECCNQSREEKSSGLEAKLRRLADLGVDMKPMRSQPSHASAVDGSDAASKEGIFSSALEQIEKAFDEPPLNQKP